jgi:hypothetical protein
MGDETGSAREPPAFGWKDLIGARQEPVGPPSILAARRTKSETLLERLDDLVCKPVLDRLFGG